METTGKQFRKRSAILSCLRASRQHPSAEELFQKLQQTDPDISRATVYRNLALFKEQGLIVSLGTVEGVERFDGDIRPHVHFVCNRCGSVSDLPPAPGLAPVMEDAAQTLGCQVDGYRLLFHGICCECKNQVHENR